MANNRQYHHGNLEHVLLEEATRMIGESGVEQLSMRGLADSVGVSRTAAYHHFKNKNELLCAIAEAGFQAWQQRFSNLFSQRPEPLMPWLRQFVQRYIGFARDHSEQYDLMFGRPVWKNGEATVSLERCSGATFHQYVEFIKACQSEGIFGSHIESLRLAQVSWSMLHGMCRLINDGVYLDNEAIESMCDAAVKLLARSVSDTGEV
ncbi:TetR/AcrR family transcriptional regulator [Endozoicomonas sp.]|nr:TetR/AcrR family transcriptional regulator [Endozoicomonas sp.]